LPHFLLSGHVMMAEEFPGIRCPSNKRDDRSASTSATPSICEVPALGSGLRQALLLFLASIFILDFLPVAYAVTADEIGANWADISYYDLLGVTKKASTAEIKQAYRRQALKWHPDKHTSENRGVAEEKFRTVAQAYEVLSDKSRRRAYDANPSPSGSTAVDQRTEGGSSFGFRDPFSMFEANFGDTLWRDWQPGDSVSGVLVRKGQRVSITIHPDGSTTESVEELQGGRGSGGGYSYKKKSGSGGTSVHIQLDGGAIVELLADTILPKWVRDAPMVGGAIAMLASWTPLLLCASTCWLCCGPRKYRAA